ncbi:hypothetical protein [Aliterella atlantica]|nr:hypothetical protein [Aliterella atlantica]
MELILFLVMDLLFRESVWEYVLLLGAMIEVMEMLLFAVQIHQ